MQSPALSRTVSASSTRSTSPETTTSRSIVSVRCIPGPRAGYAHFKETRELRPSLRKESRLVDRPNYRRDHRSHEGRASRGRRELEDVTGRVAARVDVFRRQVDMPNSMLTEPGGVEGDRVRWLAVVDHRRALLLVSPGHDAAHAEIVLGSRG